MATVVKDRLQPYRVARRARTRIYLEGAGQAFNKGDLLKTDTSAGKNRVVLAGADEARILGMADEDATGTADAEISVIIAHVDDEWVGNVSGTLDRTHLDQDFGIVRDSAGIWLVDLSDTVNTRVRVVKLLDEHGDVNGRVIFTWIATNNVYGAHVAGATQTLSKLASAPAAPGAGKVIVYAVPGTTSGVKLGFKAGTSTQEAVIQDDVPEQSVEGQVGALRAARALLADGISSAPAYSWANDLDLGPWRIGADEQGHAGSLAIRGPRPWVDVRAYATGNGTTDDRAAIATADAAATASGTLRFTAGTYKISSNITISAATFFDNGAVLSPDAGVTVTLSGPLQAGLYKIFTTGAGTISITGKVLYLVPQWWGAKGDGVTDDIVALRAAYNAVAAISNSHVGLLQQTSKPEMYFLTGVYRISGAINNAQDVNFTSFIGADSIILMDAGVTAFDQVRYMTQFKGLQFKDGATAIHLKTGNVDTSTHDVENCTFVGQTHSSIRIDSTSASTLLTVRKSKFRTPTTGTPYVLFAESGDSIVFEDTWVFADGTGVAFQNGSVSVSAKLIFRNVFGVPGANLAAWVENFGTFSAHHTRFGGESGGADITVINRASGDFVQPSIPNGVVIEDSDVYVPAGGAVIKFFGIPNQVIVRGNRGMIDLPMFIIDATVPAADLDAIGGQFSLFIVEQNQEKVGEFVDYRQGNAKVVKGLPFANEKSRSWAVGPLIDADVLINSAGFTAGFGAIVPSSAFVTITNPNDELGVASQRILSTANGGLHVRDHTTALSGLAAGVLTGVLAFEVETDHLIRVRFEVGISQTLRHFGRGRHILSMPFFWSGSGEQSLVYAVDDLPNTAQILFTRFYVLRGHRVSQNKSVVLSQTAAPTAGQWHRGDTAINSAVAAGSNYGWINTTAGTPGTWVPFGAVEAPNAYTPTNVTTDRAFDADTVAIAELADVVGTLIADMKTQGLLK